MEYMYAALLLNETGEELNETNLSAVLEAAGRSPEDSRIKAIVAAFEGVDIDDIAASHTDSEPTHEAQSGAGRPDHTGDSSPIGTEDESSDPGPNSKETSGSESSNVGAVSEGHLSTEEE